MCVCVCVCVSILVCMYCNTEACIILSDIAVRVGFGSDKYRIRHPEHNIEG